MLCARRKYDNFHGEHIRLNYEGTCAGSAHANVTAQRPLVKSAKQRAHNNKMDQQITRVEQLLTILKMCIKRTTAYLIIYAYLRLAEPC